MPVSWHVAGISRPLPVSRLPSEDLQKNRLRFFLSVDAQPPDTASLFSEGAEVIKLHIEGSLTIPKQGLTQSLPLRMLNIDL